MFDTRYVRGYRDDSHEFPIIFPLARVVDVEMADPDHDRPFFIEVDWSGTQRMPFPQQIHCEYIQTTADLLYPVEFKIAVDWLQQCLAEEKAIKQRIADRQAAEGREDDL